MMKREEKEKRKRRRVEMDDYVLPSYTPARSLSPSPVVFNLIVELVIELNSDFS
jgi:hypothetical protein